MSRTEYCLLMNTTHCSLSLGNLCKDQNADIYSDPKAPMCSNWGGVLDTDHAIRDAAFMALVVGPEFVVVTEIQDDGSYVQTAEDRTGAKDALYWSLRSRMADEW